jgi:hypothetical protein
MGGRGFGKVVSAKTSKPEIYTLMHSGVDGCVRVLQVEATSRKQALKKFNLFIDLLNACLGDATDQQILNRIDGGEV